jgi:hypothetical protein
MTEVDIGHQQRYWDCPQSLLLAAGIHEFSTACFIIFLDASRREGCIGARV